MLKNYETKILKVNTSLRGVPAGSQIKVKAKKGILLDSYWRRRLIDSEIDNCVEIVEQPKQKSVKKAND